MFCAALPQSAVADAITRSRRSSSSYLDHNYNGQKKLSTDRLSIAKASFTKVSRDEHYSTSCRDHSTHQDMRPSSRNSARLAMPCRPQVLSCDVYRVPCRPQRSGWWTSLPLVRAASTCSNDQTRSLCLPQSLAIAFDGLQPRSKWQLRCILPSTSPHAH